MFDENNLTHASALEVELQSNPIGMDYDLQKGVGFNLGKLNGSANNKEGVWVKPPLTVGSLWEKVSLFDLKGDSSSVDREVMRLLLSQPHDLNIDRMEDDILSILHTTTNMHKLVRDRVRLMSRAEVLWGAGSIVPPVSFLKARGLQF